MWTLEDYFTHARHAHISVLAVTRDAEGRGVGRALMEHAEALGARARASTDHAERVRRERESAQALYERARHSQSEMRRLTSR